MAKHSRHHHRSFFSKIKKWVGLGNSTPKVHSSPFKSVENVENTVASVLPDATPFDELVVKVQPHHRQTGERTHHHRQRLKKGWIQTIKFRLHRLFAGSRNPRRKSTITRVILRIKSMFGFHSATRKPRPELFYKLDKEGEYKVIQAKPVSSTGINEEGIAPKVYSDEGIHNHRQKNIQRWKSHTHQLWRKFRRFFKRKQNQERSQAHIPGAVNTYEEAVTAFAQNEQVKKHSGRPKHGQFSFRELISSWLSLSFVLKLLSSMGLFITAYIISWLTYSLAIMVMASFSEIYGVLYYFEVMWPEGSSSSLLNESNAMAIAFAGPLISMVMSLIYFVILKQVKNTGTQFKTLLFWLFLLSNAHFFGAILAGSVTRQGFGYVMGWADISTFLSFLISLLSLSAMAWLGWRFARFILEIRPVKKHGNNISLILINRMALPCLLGILLLVFIKLPNTTPQHPNLWDYDVIILISVLFAVIPPIFNKKLRPEQNLQKTVLTHDRTARAFFAIILSASVLILYRLGLSTGLYIYMKFAIHISSF